MLGAVVDQLSGNLVRIAERQTFFCEIIGAVGGVQESTAGCRAHIVFAHTHRGKHRGKDRQALLDGIHGVKYALFVLLHILIVGQRKRFHDCEQAHETAVNSARLAAYQLGHVRVFLLRHDGRAGCVRVVQLNELELPAAPENDFLTETAQVHHNQAQIAQQLDGIVAVGHAIQTVHHRGVKAQRLCRLETVDGICRPRQRAGAERTLIHPRAAVFQPRDIAPEHTAVGQKMLCKCDRLRPLQMRIAGHHGILILSSQLDERFLQRQQHRFDRTGLAAQIHPEIQCHLIVAASGRVQALACVADALRQKRLDIHVDILVLSAERNLARLDVKQNLLQAGTDGLRVIL